MITPIAPINAVNFIIYGVFLLFIFFNVFYQNNLKKINAPVVNKENIVQKNKNDIKLNANKLIKLDSLIILKKK